MKVIATTMGYYANKVRKEGDVFSIKGKEDLGRWMKVIEEKEAPKKNEKKQKEDRGEDLV